MRIWLQDQVYTVPCAIIVHGVFQVSVSYDKSALEYQDSIEMS